MSYIEAKPRGKIHPRSLLFNGDVDIKNWRFLSLITVEDTSIAHDIRQLKKGSKFVQISPDNALGTVQLNGEKQLNKIMLRGIIFVRSKS